MKFRATLILIGALAIQFTLYSEDAFAGVIATWHFDEVSGNTAFDSAGSVDGSLMGDASFTAGGVAGGAVQMSLAGDGFVDMGNNFGFDGSSLFSYSVWFKLNNGDTNGYIVAGHHVATVVAGYFLGVNDTGSGSGEATGSAIFYKSYPNPVSADLGLNDGGWHHLVGVHDSVSNVAHLYVDGVLQNSQPTSPFSPSSANFAVGGIHVSGSMTSAFTGMIDEVNIFDHALTQAEITDLFQNPGGSVNAVPEPASIGLFGGLAGLFSMAFGRRRSRQSASV